MAETDDDAEYQVMKMADSLFFHLFLVILFSLLLLVPGIISYF